MSCQVPIEQIIWMFLPSTSLILLALYMTWRCYSIPQKRWRFLAMLVWLSIALAAQGVTLLTLFMPQETVESFRIVHWIDKTVAIIGYASIATTCWLMWDHYKRLGYAK